MGLIDELRQRAKHVVGPFIGIVLVSYFVFHTVHGDRGVLALIKMRERLAEAEFRLNALRVEEARWEHKVKLLHPDSIDPDMLDERVRLMLGYAEANDQVVLIDQTSTVVLLDQNNQ
jgi:cell division protein FtsB